MKFNNFFVTTRVDGLVQIWVPPINHPEGELVAQIDASLVPAFISALKKFEQKEGRK